MTDPYKVLGISPEATDEQVKAAYRELAKKYHPDNYADNPLSDLAQEKMKAINEAYDTIMNQRATGRGTASAASGAGGYRAGTAAGSGQFADIRRLIRANRVEEAEELLNGVPQQSRDAEWNFLKGSVFYSRGWLDEAAEYFTKASNMDPSNQEYKAAINQLMWQRNGGARYNPYGSTTQQSGGPGCSVCDICGGLMCMDCLCGSGRMCC